MIKEWNIWQMLLNTTTYNYLMHSLLYSINNSFFSQAITTLKLGSNQVGHQGVQHLANALKQNRVISTVLPIRIIAHCFLQTLVALDLFTNNIGNQGAHYLANALQHNNVIQSFQPSLSDYTFTLFHRHCLHWIWVRTISMIREHNIWGMLSKRTK